MLRHDSFEVILARQPEQAVAICVNAVTVEKTFPTLDAVMFAWSHKRADYTPSAGAEDYIRQYLAGRFPTFPLLDAAWEKAK